jgi:hypothetical protein
MSNSKKERFHIIRHSDFVIDSSFAICHLYLSFLDVESLAVSSANS